MAKENISYVIKGSSSEDNLEGIGYDKRYLDALASIFHVQGDVTAITRSLTGEFDLSYNSTLSNKILKKAVNRMEGYINELTYPKSTQICKNLLFEYLVYNNDFFRCYNLIGIKLPYGISKMIQYLHKELAKYAPKPKPPKLKNNKPDSKEGNKKNASELLKKVDKDTLVDYYAKLLILMKDYDLYKIYKDSNLFEKAIRPYQDVTKFLTFFMYSIHIGKIKTPITLNILENPFDIHTESNLAIHYHIKSKIKDYVGVSRLCCAVCDKFLSAKVDGWDTYKHRGTHNTWVIEPWQKSLKQTKVLTNVVKLIFEDLEKESEPTSEQNSHRHSQQQRRLSTDFLYETEWSEQIKRSLGFKEASLSGEVNDINIGWINSHFGNYTLQGLENILDLRISDLQLKSIKITLGVFIDRIDNNISEVISQIFLSTEKTILVPLNLFNKHAVGLVFEKSGDDSSLKITYFDPLNKPIPKELQKLILDALDFEIIFKEITVEQQKYSNCGSEVIENFILYLTGKRVSQEKAVKLHSQLVESSLIIKDTVLKTVECIPQDGSCEIELLGD